MGHGFLGCLPVVRVVGQGHNEERTPEYQVGHRDHNEHFHLMYDDDDCVSKNASYQIQSAY